MKVVLSKAQRWSAGRPWQLKALIVAYIFYAGLEYLGDAGATSIFSGAFAFIFSMARDITASLGEPQAALASLVILHSLPLVAAVFFWFQREYFAATIVLSLYGFTLLESSQLILHSTAGEAMVASATGIAGSGAWDSWVAVVQSLSLAGHEAWLSSSVRAIGALAWLVSVASSAVLCWFMVFPRYGSPVATAVMHNGHRRRLF